MLFFLETGSKFVEMFVVVLLRTSYLVSRSTKFGLINIKSNKVMLLKSSKLTPELCCIPVVMGISGSGVEKVGFC